MAIAVATNYHFRPQVGEWPFWTWPWLHVATIANIARWLLNCFEHSEVVVLAVAFSSSMLDEGNPKRWSNIWGWKIRRTITPYYMWNLKHPCKNGCFHFDDEPNLHMKNAWTSPFPSIWTWLLRVPGIIHIYIYMYTYIYIIYIYVYIYIYIIYICLCTLCTVYTQKILSGSNFAPLLGSSPLYRSS